MSLDLADYRTLAESAVKRFWESRDSARKRQAEVGRADQGERSGVTAGKNLDGFHDLVEAVVRANGLPGAVIHRERALVTLPGYFRATKLWDVLVTHEGRLVAAIEFKSHVGPSFSNNLNNRAEEAIGTAADLWVAHRDSAYGATERPFVGWLMVLEDCEASRAAIAIRSPHFPVFPDFESTSCADRYRILCEKLMKERYYTGAALILTRRQDARGGNYSEMTPSTGLRAFVASLAGHVASEAARTA